MPRRSQCVFGCQQFGMYYRWAGRTIATAITVYIISMVIFRSDSIRCLTTSICFTSVPETSLERFLQWKDIVGPKWQDKTNDDIYTNYRICNHHFEGLYCYPHSKRLAKTAYPTLKLGSSASSSQDVSIEIQLLPQPLPESMDIHSVPQTLPGCSAHVSNLDLMNKTGLNSVISDQMKDATEKLTTEQRLCVLMFDEMAISPSMHFDVPSDQIIGFEDMGSVHTENIADHVQDSKMKVKHAAQVFSQRVSGALRFCTIGFMLVLTNGNSTCLGTQIADNYSESAAWNSVISVCLPRSPSSIQ
ncbi:unnamed protein product [Arctia plantaginis]|uniref:THAP-type domain-containing protein n=1 Tax=Arctia plantaginis TaxID=874455 RepID=A0A8S1AKQ1_ARCPL|nr:unnamed protein product [Arctia plantaginis]